MHFGYIPGKTIAAIATPPGEGGVAIIRISGTSALDIGNAVFSKNLNLIPSHTVQYGTIQNKRGEKIDSVLILPMRAPKSYTGEDTVEIFCHGGSLISKKVLQVVLEAGAQSALPGEFTFKAFINGKMDLTQAEAVQKMIGAKNEKALDAAEKQLQGGLSLAVKPWQEKVTLIAAILEAWVDFPDEGLEFATFDEIILDLKTLIDSMQMLIDTFHDGKVIHEGLTLCLIGAPNVGKSSLMNALLQKERAIVSPIAGTTRDVLEDDLRLAGLNFKILDTAGIRKTEETIEKEGIRRTEKAYQEADLILVVLDVTAPTPDFILTLPSHKTVAIWNKCDLKHPDLPDLPFSHVVHVSALEKTGLVSLKESIESIIWTKGPPSKEEVVLTQVRHKEALCEAVLSLQNVIDGLQKNVSPEFVSFDIRHALHALQKILGTNVSEDILNAIFSTFCIGK